jgi:hypothetical protein
MPLLVGITLGSGSLYMKKNCQRGTHSLDLIVIDVKNFPFLAPIMESLAEK